MQFARKIADRALVMEGGRIVEAGPPSELLDAPRDPRSRAFLRRAVKG